MTKIHDVYQALISLSRDGICTATQSEIAQKAGITRPWIIPALRSLADSGVIAISSNTARHYGAGSRNIYTLLNRNNLERQVKTESGKPDLVLKPDQEIQKLSQVLDRFIRFFDQKPDSVAKLSQENLTQSPENLTQSQQEIMIHACMNDELIIKNNKKKSKQEKAEILTLLDMLDSGERQKRASMRHVTVDYARRWRAWCDSGDFGDIVNPAGYINWAIQRRQEPPNAGGQISLPAGSLDLSDFQSRGMTREEIQTHLAPADGAIIGEDGIWR